MIKVTVSKSFKKNYKKRINSQQLQTKFQKRLELFMKNPKSKTLRDHKLKGQMSEYRSFSITGDIRVIYEVLDTNHVLFIDVGSHNQVY